MRTKACHVVDSWVTRSASDRVTMNKDVGNPVLALDEDAAHAELDCQDEIDVSTVETRTERHLGTGFGEPG